MEDRASYQMILIESKKNRLYTSRVSFIVILLLGIFIFKVSQHDAYEYIDLKNSHTETTGIHLRTVFEKSKQYIHYYSYKDKSGKLYTFKRTQKTNNKSSKKPQYVLIEKKIKIFFLPTNPYKSYGLYPTSWLSWIYINYIFNRIGLVLIIITSLMIPYYCKKIYRFNKRIKLGYEHK